MDDLFTEILIPRKQTAKNMAIKVGLVVLTVAAFGMALFNPLFILAGFGMVLLDWWQFPKQTQELEYAYVSGELEIDTVYSKQSRKKGPTFLVTEAELVAPITSDKVSDYRNLPERDFTSGAEEDRKKAWVMVMAANGKRERILFSPNEKMLQDIRRRIPSKFFNY